MFNIVETSKTGIIITQKQTRNDAEKFFMERFDVLIKDKSCLTGNINAYGDTKSANILHAENNYSLSIVEAPSVHIEIPVSNGILSCDTSFDPCYPGLDTEYISNQEDENTAATRPRVCIEENTDSNEIRCIVWKDPSEEDYSEKIILPANYTETERR